MVKVLLNGNINPQKRGFIMNGEIFKGALLDSGDGKFLVIDFSGTTKPVGIRFIDTGFSYYADWSNVKKGRVRDKMKRKTAGVGFFGVGPYKSKCKGKASKCYSIWHQMIKRCYDHEYQKSKCPTYEGCVVCDEWHNFQNFAKWYEENYPKDGGKYALDKDIKFEGNKTYSPENCIFVTQEENNIKARCMSVDLVSPSGEVVKVNNAAEFCRAKGLDNSNLSKVINGKASSHKGWRKLMVTKC